MRNTSMLRRLLRWTAIASCLAACGGSGNDAKPVMFVGNDGGVSVSTDGGKTFTTGTMDGITYQEALDVAVVGSRVYAATYEGVWVSTDGGASYSSADGALANENVNCLLAVGTTLYAGTQGEGVWVSEDGGPFTRTWEIIGTGGSDYVKDLAIAGLTVAAATSDGLWVSIDGGTTFAFLTLANSELPSHSVSGVFVSGSTIYAATRPYNDGMVLHPGGLAITADGGAHFVTRTSADGLGADDVFNVFVSGSKVYAATRAGLSISTDGGEHFVNRTIADGLGSDMVWSVLVSRSTVYAFTSGGLSISTDGGEHFVNRTTADGLAGNSVYGVALH